MEAKITNPEQAPLDTALASLVLLLSFLDRPADPDQLRHTLGKGSQLMDANDLVRLARKLDVEARRVVVATDRLERMPLPAIAVLGNGEHLVLLRLSGDQALV